MLQNEEILRRKPKEGYGFIYLYTFDNGKQYVGQTITSVWERHLGHLQHDLAVDLCMKKHEYTLEPLLEVPIEELNEKEQFCVLKYNTYAPIGLNMTLGGDATYLQDANNGAKHSEALLKYYAENPYPESAKKKISEFQSIYWKTHTHHSKGKPAWNRGKKHREESKEKESLSLKKHYDSEAGDITRAKISVAHKGIPFTKEHSQKIAEAQTVAWARRHAIWYFFEQLNALDRDDSEDKWKDVKREHYMSTQSYRKAQSAGLKAAWAKKSKEERHEIAMKGIKTRSERFKNRTNEDKEKLSKTLSEARTRSNAVRYAILYFFKTLNTITLNTQKRIEDYV